MNDRVTTNYNKQGQLLLNLILQTKQVGGIPCLIKSIAQGDTAKLTFMWFPYDHITKTTGVKINVVYTNENVQE